jgi:hypothetical protein
MGVHSRVEKIYQVMGEFERAQGRAPSLGELSQLLQPKEPTGDRRSEERLAVDGEVCLMDPDEGGLSGTVVDISAGGAQVRLETARVPQLNRTLELLLLDADREMDMELQVRVVYVRQTYEGTLLGLAFAQKQVDSAPVLAWAERNAA